MTKKAAAVQNGTGDAKEWKKSARRPADSIPELDDLGAQLSVCLIRVASRPLCWRWLWLLTIDAASLEGRNCWQLATACSARRQVRPPVGARERAGLKSTWPRQFSLGRVPYCTTGEATKAYTQRDARNARHGSNRSPTERSHLSQAMTPSARSPPSSGRGYCSQG